MLEKANATDLGPWVNDLYMKVTGGTVEEFHRHPSEFEDNGNSFE